MENFEQEGKCVNGIFMPAAQANIETNINK